MLASIPNPIHLSPCRIVAWGVVTCLLMFSSGCTMLELPAVMGASSPGDRYTPVGAGHATSAAPSVDVYQKVRQAKAQNSIVLEIVGDGEPVRVLPLPPNGRSVFVSTLLTQTGVLAKLGKIEATLYRSSATSLGGVRMAVSMDQSGEAVRPESDYALRAGDRLQVRKFQGSAFQNLVDAALLR